MDHSHEASARPERDWRFALVLLCVLAVAGIFLLTEHRPHALGVLPYAVLLLCPLIHVFKHGGVPATPARPQRRRVLS